MLLHRIRAVSLVCFDRILTVCCSNLRNATPFIEYELIFCIKYIFLFLQVEGFGDLRGPILRQMAQQLSLVLCDSRREQSNF